MPDPVERKLAAITDIVGYTALMAERERGLVQPGCRLLTADLLFTREYDRYPARGPSRCRVCK